MVHLFTSTARSSWTDRGYSTTDQSSKLINMRRLSRIAPKMGEGWKPAHPKSNFCLQKANFVDTIIWNVSREFQPKSATEVDWWLEQGNKK
jgi:hypothetical protein